MRFLHFLAEGPPKPSEVWQFNWDSVSDVSWMFDLRIGPYDDPIISTQEIAGMLATIIVGALVIFGVRFGVRLIKRSIKASTDEGLPDGVHGPVEYGKDYWESWGPQRDIDFALARGEFPDDETLEELYEEGYDERGPDAGAITDDIDEEDIPF